MSHKHNCRTGKICTVQIKNKLSVFKILCWKAFILYEQGEQVKQRLTN